MDKKHPDQEPLLMQQKAANRALPLVGCAVGIALHPIKSVSQMQQDPLQHLKRNPTTSSLFLGDKEEHDIPVCEVLCCKKAVLIFQEQRQKLLSDMSSHYLIVP